MADVKPDHVYTENLRVLEKIMGMMFNNVKFSDTVFTVKEQKFYALSQLLAASSATLDSLISTHYEHCHDKDIKLYGIRNEESFMIILQYIYGMNINFSQMNITVMCEVLTLSEKYKVDDFFKDLKCFLSKMDCFQLDSVVALLNTASKYNISELYKRVTVFAYENTEELVKHETFCDLQYNVLVDLIKSDWFYCSEIDILTSVLTWHTDMYDESKNTKKTIENDNIVSEDDDAGDSINDKMDTSRGTELVDVEEYMNIEDSDLNKKDESLNADDGDSIHDKMDISKGTAIVDVKEETMNIEDSDLNKKDDSLNADDDDSIHDKMDNISKGTAIVDVKEETMNIEDNDLNEKDESLNAEDSEEIQSAILDKRNKCKETLKSFCENVLISLLGHIRLSEISAKVWMTSHTTDWFKKYSGYLQNADYFSQSSKPRQKYAAVTSDEQEGRNDASANVSNKPMLKYSVIGRIQDHVDTLTAQQLKQKRFILSLLTIAGVSILEWDAIHFQSISFLFNMGQCYWMVFIKITSSNKIFARLRSIYNGEETWIPLGSVPAESDGIFAHRVLSHLAAVGMRQSRIFSINGIPQQILELEQCIKYLDVRVV